MEQAPLSTALSHAPTSQEVLQPEDYNLAAEISQFSEFRDKDWESDLINNPNFKALDQEDSLFLSNLDANNKNIEGPEHCSN
jgi:hypothetical protein